jgi:hypothetical protein
MKLCTSFQTDLLTQRRRQLPDFLLKILRSKILFTIAYLFRKLQIYVSDHQPHYFLIINHITHE